MKNRLDLRSLLRISAMALGTGVAHQFAPILAHLAEAEIVNFFKPPQNRNADGNYSARSTVSRFGRGLN
jgi:hypothetical protein